MVLLSWVPMVKAGVKAVVSLGCECEGEGGVEVVVNVVVKVGAKAGAKGWAKEGVKAVAKWWAKVGVEVGVKLGGEGLMMVVVGRCWLLLADDGWLMVAG